MTVLIQTQQTTFNEASVQTVNARELHAFLEVGKDFTNWIKDRIKKYGFVEDQDYVLTLAKTGERRNVVKTEYHLTLDMAKELSMVERNAKGKQARQYFIECERQAKELTAEPFQVPRSLPDALRLAADQADRASKAEAKLVEIQPQADFAASIVKSDRDLLVNEAAKLIDVRPKALWDFLKAGWIYRRGGSWLPRQEKINQGLMRYKVSGYEHPEKGRQDSFTPLLTPKGLGKAHQALGGAQAVLPGTQEAA